MKTTMVFLAGMCIGALLLAVLMVRQPEPAVPKELPEIEIEMLRIPEVQKYVFPIHPDDWLQGELTSPYGERDPQEIGGLGDIFHDGLDLYGVSHVGTWQARIVAIADGYVLDHWIHHEVYGKMIRLQHADGVQSVYAHLSKSFVHECTEDGELWYVKAGEVIGRQGNTGLSKGRLEYKSHLHFELWIDDELVNPLRYLWIPGE